MFKNIKSGKTNRFIIFGTIACLSIILSHLIISQNISNFLSGFGISLMPICLIANFKIKASF